MSQQASLFSTEYSNSNQLSILEKKLQFHVMSNEHMENSNSLTIHYSFQETILGKIIIASTTLGICYASFYDEQKGALTNLKHHFQDFTIIAKEKDAHKKALLFFQKEENKWPSITLHVKGTQFQLNVWKALLKIPLGKLSNYISIATILGNSKASRAVGTAIGKNPIAYIIPCHRVIQTNGQLGGYMWGIERKAAILNWELNK